MINHTAQHINLLHRLAVCWIGISCVLALATAAFADGIGIRFDVTCSRPVMDSQGALLLGANPWAGDFGFAAEEGSLVQIINAGPNGVPDLPDADGAPSGDDVLFAEASMGEGMAPNLASSGRFAVSFFPPPPSGSKVYVRAFNGTTLASSTRWGQSNVHTVKGSAVLDASPLGLWATTQPLGTDLMRTDTDGDGHTDYAELLANTNADDTNDILTAGPISRIGQVELAARAGRRYRLMRSTDSLAENMSWTPVASTETLGMNQDLVLSDASPPDAGLAFYRVEVYAP
jgi:hypothetical protein